MHVILVPQTVDTTENMDDKLKGSWILQQFGFWSVCFTYRFESIQKHYVEPSYSANDKTMNIMLGF